MHSSPNQHRGLACFHWWRAGEESKGHVAGGESKRKEFHFPSCSSIGNQDKPGTTVRRENTRSHSDLDMWNRLAPYVLRLFGRHGKSTVNKFKLKNFCEWTVIAASPARHGKNVFFRSIHSDSVSDSDSDGSVFLMFYSISANVYIFEQWAYSILLRFLNSLPLETASKAKIKLNLFIFAKLFFVFLLSKVFLSLGYLFMDELSKAIAPFYPGRNVWWVRSTTWTFWEFIFFSY